LLEFVAPDTVLTPSVPCFLTTSGIIESLALSKRAAVSF